MRLFGKVAWLIASISMIFLLLGCSSGRTSDPLIPKSQTAKGMGCAIEPGLNHSLLGYYSFIVDPENNTVDTVPLRETMLHLNALRFLEPPPPFKIITSGFTYDGEKADLDVKLVHPFPGLTKYDGFDVCGIVITSGSISGFSDPDIVIAGESDTRLINADGLTRWWNPREFPHNSSTPVFGYIDGVKGVPDAIGNFSATLNGYKYFADGLSKDEGVGNIPPEKRGMFSAGAANTRHYTIDMSGGFVFNYAVDACWYPPIEEPVTGPESFSESANREEPWLVEADNETNTLWFDTATGTSGGELGLDIRCYDWFHADKNTVRVESPGNFSPVTSAVPIGGDSVYSTYHVDITNPTFSSANPITVWVSAEADMGYQGILPGKPTSAYMIPLPVDVSSSPPQNGLIWTSEKVIDHPDRVPNNDIDPALIINGEGDILCAFFFWYNDAPDQWWNCPRFATSHDNGHNFGEVDYGGWMGHGVDVPRICSVSKCCLGSNGWAFHSYFAPMGLAFSAIPRFEPLTYANSWRWNGLEDKPVYSHDMLYTLDGFPMVFYDEDGMIQMARGTMPNIAGSGDGWPEFKGTDHMIDDSGSKWLSKVRASGKTSDGICHIFYWNSEGLDYIQAVSSTDTTGTDWNDPNVVFAGLAEIWVAARNPSLWIDKDDGFHTAFAAEDWMGNFHLMYGYSVDGTLWDEGKSFQQIDTFPPDAGLNDTEVIVFDAVGKTWVFVSYETGENVYCRYKEFGGSDWSDAIQVNEHSPARLPDIFPNENDGIVFAYEADDGTGNDLTDIFYRVAEFQ